MKADFFYEKRLGETASVVENKARNRDEAINSYKFDSYEKLLISWLNPKPWALKLRILHPFSFVKRMQ